MGQEIKSIRKQFRITRQEEKQIKEMMREQKMDSFSEFLRQNLLKKNYQDRIFESWVISKDGLIRLGIDHL